MSPWRLQREVGVGVDANSTLIGAAAVVILGVGCQWIARSLNIPPLLFLLPAGLIAGDVLGVVKPAESLGDAMFPLVSALVGLVLFQAGLRLRVSDLPREARRPVWRLITASGFVTFAAVTATILLLLDVPTELAFVMGAILVVSGPTVVGPLVRIVRPKDPLGAILNWESTTLDPLGAVLGVVVLNVVLFSGSGHANPIVSMLQRLGWGLLVGLVAAAILLLVIRLFLVTDEMEPAVALLFAVAAFTAAETTLSESGLVASLVLGLVLANQNVFPTQRIGGFGETLDVLIIGSLFIILGATVTIDSMLEYLWEIIAIVAILVLIVRPLAAGLALARSHLTWRERAMISWVDPRGIVAAATAAQFTPVLAGVGIDSDPVLPVVFGVVFGTGLVYGVTALPIAKALKMAQPPPNGVIFLGGGDWVVGLIEELQERGVPAVLLTETSEEAEGLNVPNFALHDPAMKLEQALQNTNLAWVVVVGDPNGAVQLTTALCVERFGRRHVLTLPVVEGGRSRLTSQAVGISDYVPGHTREELERAFARGSEITVLGTAPIDQDSSQVPLAAIAPSGRLLMRTRRRVPAGSVILGIDTGPGPVDRQESLDKEA